LREAASSSTLLATPWALKIVTTRRHLGQILDKPGAFGLEALDHVLVVYDLVAHITGGPYFTSARSTISIARTTPAQKPRGWAE
jgi:hypothetical protein